MKCLFMVLMAVGVLSSCDFDEPEINGLSNFKLGKLEGKNIDVSFDAQILNDNTYNIKIKSGKLNVSANGIDLGVIDLSQKIKLIKKSENKYQVFLKATLADGILLKIPRLATASTYDLRLEGTARASVMGIGKSFKVDEKRKLMKDNLKLEGLLEQFKGVVK